MANAIASRPDIHKAFDDCKFVITRKDNKWVVHFLEMTYSLGSMYHNRPVEIAAGVSIEFLLMRFAWAIFPLVKTFMEAGPSRLVKLRQRIADGRDEEVTKTLDPVTFAQMGISGRGRRSSLKKRKLSSASSLPSSASLPMTTIVWRRIQMKKSLSLRQILWLDFVSANYANDALHTIHP